MKGVARGLSSFTPTLSIFSLDPPSASTIARTLPML